MFLKILNHQDFKMTARFRSTEFLKLGAIGVSKFGSEHARKAWALAATKRMLKKPGCMASAICLAQVQGTRRFLQLVAHSRGGGQVEWQYAGGKKMFIGPMNVLKPRCAPGDTNLWFMRDKDAEFLLLNSIANRWSPNDVTDGFIAMHVEYPPCGSCADVIDQFRGLYPQVDLLVQWNRVTSVTAGPRPAARCGSPSAACCVDFTTATGMCCHQCKT